MSYPRKEERNKDILKLRADGWTLRQIAYHFNVNVKNVWRICKHENMQQSVDNKAIDLLALE